MEMMTTTTTTGEGDDDDGGDDNGGDNDDGGDGDSARDCGQLQPRLRATTTAHVGVIIIWPCSVSRRPTEHDRAASKRMVCVLSGGRRGGCGGHQRTLRSRWMMLHFCSKNSAEHIC
jgi:hypothetical protein